MLGVTIVFLLIRSEKRCFHRPHGGIRSQDACFQATKNHNSIGMLRSSIILYNGIGNNLEIIHILKDSRLLGTGNGFRHENR